MLFEQTPITSNLKENASQVSNNLEDGSWVEFGGNITFSCKNDHLFEDDPEITKFYAECLNNGSFVNHLPWKKCLNSKKRYVKFGLNWRLSFIFLALDTVQILHLRPQAAAITGNVP